jgi:hypothetical protein
MKGVNTVEEHETFEVEVNSLEEARHIGSLRWSVDPSDIDIRVMDEGKGFSASWARRSASP